MDCAVKFSEEEQKAFREKIHAEYLERVTYRDSIKTNNFDFDGPIIAWCPAWALTHTAKSEPDYIVDEETGEHLLGYSKFLLRKYSEMIAQAGGHLVHLRLEDKAEDFIGKVHGLLIPGGSDLDPAFYGEENTHAKLDEENGVKRQANMTDWIQNCDHKMPIYGICLGSQFLNCLEGGKLNQQLDNADEHLVKARKLNVVEGTHLSKALEGAKSVYGGCAHHQGIINVPDTLVVNSYDSVDETPHGVELKDRPVFTTLWHCEINVKVSGYDDEGANQKIVDYFVNLAKDYRNTL